MSSHRDSFLDASTKNMHPPGFACYEPLREFMTKHGLNHEGCDILINLDKMVASASVVNGKGTVTISGRTYKTDYNQSTSINAVIDSVRNRVNDDDRYIDIGVLYQALVVKGSKISHGCFREFVEICDDMPQDANGFP
jgi:hypothetical protein